MGTECWTGYTRDYKYLDFNAPFHVQLNTTSCPMDTLLTKITLPSSGTKTHSYKLFGRNLNPDYSSKCLVVEKVVTDDDLGNRQQVSYEFSGETSDTGTQPSGTTGTDLFRMRKVFEYDAYGNFTKRTEGDYTSSDWNNDKKETTSEYICDLNLWQFKPDKSSNINTTGI